MDDDLAPKPAHRLQPPDERYGISEWRETVAFTLTPRAVSSSFAASITESPIAYRPGGIAAEAGPRGSSARVPRRTIAKKRRAAGMT